MVKRLYSSGVNAIFTFSARKKIKAYVKSPAVAIHGIQTSLFLNYWSYIATFLGPRRFLLSKPDTGVYPKIYIIYSHLKYKCAFFKGIELLFIFYYFF